MMIVYDRDYWRHNTDRNVNNIERQNRNPKNLFSKHEFPDKAEEFNNGQNHLKMKRPML